MSKQINPISKARVKQSLLNGSSLKQSVLDAGYSPNTAINAHRLRVVKDCQSEILAEIQAKDITVDSLLKESESLKQMSIYKGDLSTATRNVENKARFVGIDKASTTINNVILTDLSNKDPDILTRMAKNRRL